MLMNFKIKNVSDYEIYNWKLFQEFFKTIHDFYKTRHRSIASKGTRFLLEILHFMQNVISVSPSAVKTVYIENIALNAITFF